MTISQDLLIARKNQSQAVLTHQFVPSMALAVLLYSSLKQKVLLPLMLMVTVISITLVHGDQ